MQLGALGAPWILKDQPERWSGRIRPTSIIRHIRGLQEVSSALLVVVVRVKNNLLMRENCGLLHISSPTEAEAKRAARSQFPIEFNKI